MFDDEVAQQPQALLDLVELYRDPAREPFSTVGALAAEKTCITFTGMGSSHYAALAVLPQFRQSGWQAESIEAGEALHYALPAWRPPGLLIAVSQSGESAETRMLAEKLSGDCPTIAVTNDETSGLARASHGVLPLCAGTESAVSTKTYTNSLGALLVLAGVLLNRDPAGALAALDAAAHAMISALRPEIDEAIEAAAAWIDTAGSVHYIARGPSLAAASVGALTIGEGARVTAAALSAAAFRHGPMELAGDGHVAVLFLPDGPTRPLMEKLREDLAKTGSRTVSLTDRPSAAIPSSAIEIVLGSVPTEAHFPLAAATGAERILAAVAARRGLVPGDFRYGGKVTVEE